jgi:hypothetical protein
MPDPLDQMPPRNRLFLLLACNADAGPMLDKKMHGIHRRIIEVRLIFPIQVLPIKSRDQNSQGLTLATGWRQRRFLRMGERMGNGTRSLTDNAFRVRRRVG